MYKQCVVTAVTHCARNTDFTKSEINTKHGTQSHQIFQASAEHVTMLLLYLTYLGESIYEDVQVHYIPIQHQTQPKS